MHTEGRGTPKMPPTSESQFMFRHWERRVSRLGDPFPLQTQPAFELEDEGGSGGMAPDEEIEWEPRFSPAGTDCTCSWDAINSGLSFGSGRLRFSHCYSS